MSVPVGAPSIPASAALSALAVHGCDFLRVMGHMDLIRFLDRNAKQGVNVESVQFSDSVLKINKRGKHQKRDLIITTANLYNFKCGEYRACQRAIPITHLKGIVLSSQTDEVLIQVRGDYDYRLLIVRQADAIRILCELHEQITGSKLPVEIAEDISRVQVLKSDVRKFRSNERAHPSEGSPRSSHLSPPSPGTPHSASPGSIDPGARGVSFLDASGNGAAQIDMKPSFEGFLTKKGQVNLLWRRRYFRLSESNLLYYEARLKGTIELVGDGEVRAWVNKRLQGSTTSTTSGGLAPLMYEYKLSAAYHLNSEKHLSDILNDEDRLAAFVAFCEHTTPPPPVLKLPVTGAAATNETGNPKFYAAVQAFKKKTLAAAPDAAAFHAAQLAEATAIYTEFLAVGTRTPINAPTPVREAIGDMLTRQGREKAVSPSLPSTLSVDAASSSSSSPLPSSCALHADMFNIAQQFALEYMQTAVLPLYLAYSKQSEANVVRSFKLKHDLTSEDKKRAACRDCLAAFGLLRRRHVCNYCGDVLCNSCLSKSSKLPPEYGIADAIPVCDMCAGSLEISHTHPHAFSYANKSRSRPINLAASSPQDQKEWMAAFAACIQQQQKKAPSATSSSSSSSTTGGSDVVCHKEGWLMKQEPRTKNWRRRYFILNPTTAQLFYYELSLKGSLSLAQGAGVHATTQKATLSPTDAQIGGLQSVSGFGFRFNISYNTRLYALSSDTEESMTQWMTALQRAIRRAKPGAGGGLGALLDANHKNTIVHPSPSPMVGLASPTSAEQYSSSFQQRAPQDEVTFVFTDVQNSTKLWELSPMGMNEGLKVHDSLLRMLLTVFNGYEVKTEGDAFMVTFFTPLDAVRWCLACQQALLETVWPADLLLQPSGSQEFKDDQLIFNGIRIRMGIHVGHPACRRNPITGRMDYFGPVVNRSARVTDSAHGGQVVCTQEVRERLVAGIQAGEFPHADLTLTDLGLHRYKGITELVQVCQINQRSLEGRNPFPHLRTTKADEPEPAEEEGPTSPPAPTLDPLVLSLGDEPECASPLCITVQSATPAAAAAAAVSAVTSPSRPSHLTVDSISAVSIHPFTPSALTRPAAECVTLDREDPSPPTSETDTSEDEDEEEDEDDSRPNQQSPHQHEQLH